MAASLPESRDGLIVNMIDQRVWRLTPNFFSYTLSKSTLWTATQTMAQALAPRIRVNAIGLGPTLKSARQSAEDFATQRKAVPLGHGPEPRRNRRDHPLFVGSPLDHRTDDRARRRPAPRLGNAGRCGHRRIAPSVRTEATAT
jgi:NAD(P)-dependent dehydrogenase (short-subunit alcohol dehydrogenase family)